MPKLKTRKAVSERLKRKKSGKIIKRTCGQGHFNARQTGNTKRNKRSDSEIGAHQKTIAQAVPYIA